MSFMENDGELAVDGNSAPTRIKCSTRLDNQSTGDSLNP
jgi:hypothetical protein